jgi:hypothetical protein
VAQNTLKALINTRVVVVAPQGFVGSIICELLIEADIDFVEISNFRDASSAEISRLAPSGSIWLINCAGTTDTNEIPSSFAFQRDNVKSLEKLLLAFENRLTRVFHFSSWLVETSDINNPYIESKRDAEVLIENNQKIFNFDTKIIRLPTIWSLKKLKKGSLLEDLVYASKIKQTLHLNNPAALCRIVSEESFKRFFLNLLVEETKSRILHVEESWHGEVSEISNLLQTSVPKEILLGNSELEALSEIFNYWLSVPH